MINLTIDGQSVEVPEGSTVLQAAREAGIDIPTLCDHPNLAPYGGCRLCVVEVEGVRTLQTSCTLPVNNNMVVHTNTNKLQEARKTVLSLLFSERNHFCPYCQVSGGDCELQNAAYDEGMTYWPLQPNWQTFSVDASHPYFILDNNRCILCRRCVRACDELVGNSTLGIEERGAKSCLVADYGIPLGESTCISCGVCVQICPTGALIDRESAYRGHEAQVNHTNSICVGCSVGCNIDVLTRDNRLVRIEGDWDGIVNGGLLCKTGRYTPLETEKTRVTTPLMRKDGVLSPVTWEEALAFASTTLKSLAGKENGVAAAASTRLPAEVLAAFKNFFTTTVKSNLVTSLDPWVTESASGKVADTVGKPFESNLDELNSADCVVVLGVDLVKEHEVAGFFVKRILSNQTPLIVIDPSENQLDLLAQYSIKPAEGNQLAALQNLAAEIKQPGGIIAPVSDAARLSDAARAIAAADHPVFIFGKETNPEVIKALLHLVSQTENGKVIGIKGNANSAAATQYHLDQPFNLNGHQAVYVALGDDDPSQALLTALEKAPFLAVQASYHSVLTERADVVFPVENWAEQEGHYLNMEGRLQNAQKSLSSPEQVWSNLAVIEGIATHMSAPITVDWKEMLYQRTPVNSIVEG